MTPEQLVQTASPIIGAMGSAFYFDRATLARGKELGLDGFRFYVLGRGGVLGDVEPAVVTSAFGYFHPATIERMWTTAREKVAPRDAGRAYIACCQEFGRTHFADVEGLDAFCRAAEAVNQAADPAGLALYAAASSEPLADDPPARAMQLVTVLRELRGSAHLVAVLASGLSPNVAHYLRRPGEYKNFGWGDEPPPVSDDDRSKQAAADALTDRLVLPAYSAPDAGGADALVAGLKAMQARLPTPG
jgi:hypothetical protein